MSRLPIRARLSLAFAVAMAVVLAATGAFVYFRVQSALDEGISEALDARLRDAVALARTGETGRRADEEGFTTIVGGRISAVPRDRVEGGTRTKGTTVETDLGLRTVLVGTSLADRDEALAELLSQLLVVAPIALLLSSLLGYLLAGAALRPVDTMRAEADAISGSEPGRRLPSGSAQDEISRLAATLNQMLGRLERTIERERGFVADASHELRTPLALLKTELELALRTPRTEEELRSAIRSAAAETDRLSRLAEDLLVLAQADEGRLPLRRESLSANDVLGSVREAFAPRAAAAGRSIEAQDADGLVIHADRLRVEQALGNLVDNALRHGAGTISLEAVEENGLVQLHVRDEGPGLTDEFRPRAFERFTRADAARTRGGSGLGLALVAAVAEAHGGAARAAPGRADFWLTVSQD
jgi:two-component system, OmpR family, sensor kinase